MNYNEQGIAYMNEKKYEEAAKMFNDAIEENPHDPTGFINFGNLLGIVGDYSRALTFFDKAIELDESAATAYYGAGTIYYKQDQFEEAAKMFKHAVHDLDGDDVHFMLGMSYYQLGALPHALASFKRTVELDPTDIDGRFQYGLCLAQLEQIDEAIKQLIEVVRMDDRHADAYFNLGVAYAYKDQAEDALASFEKALEIQPTHALAANGKKTIEQAIKDDDV
ncbi:tetratricopeptide repeat protein [bacterium LRH843]|nr:tetratricopeptide repeat protein [bacterium LRH843]